MNLDNIEDTYGELIDEMDGALGAVESAVAGIDTVTDQGAA